MLTAPSRLALLVALSTLAFAASAHAATLSVDANIFGTETITYAAAAGETNAVDIEPSPGGLTITDPGATITTLTAGHVGGVCGLNGAHEADCSTGAGAQAVGSIAVILGDGDDSFTSDPSMPIPMDVLGGPGDDTIDTGAGADTILGGAGDDTLEGQAGNDVINGGIGADTLIGDTGDDELGGGPGDDTLEGGDGNDHLDGGSGSDEFDGGAGADTIFR